MDTTASKYQAAIKKARTPLTTDIGIDPVGNEDFVPIVKKEYGFDWEKSKGLDIDEYRPEGWQRAE